MAHIRVVLVAIISQTYLGLLTAVATMVAHGLASSGIFRATGVIYQRLHSRNMLLSSGHTGVAPIFTLLWFSLCVCIMGGPPSFNLITEIIAMASIFG